MPRLKRLLRKCLDFAVCRQDIPVWCVEPKEYAMVRPFPVTVPADDIAGERILQTPINIACSGQWAYQDVLVWQVLHEGRQVRRHPAMMYGAKQRDSRSNALQICSARFASRTVFGIADRVAERQEKGQTYAKADQYLNCAIATVFLLLHLVCRKDE